jgi:hypothetical protein
MICGNRIPQIKSDPELLPQNYKDEEKPELPSILNVYLSNKKITVLKILFQYFAKLGQLLSSAGLK